jgi:hypothetical protein
VCLFGIQGLVLRLVDCAVSKFSSFHERPPVGRHGGLWCESKSYLCAVGREATEDSGLTDA